VARKIVDDDGVEVTAGCVIHFSYGAPGVGVDAPVIERDGRLIALTPGHKPAVPFSEVSTPAE